MFSVGDPVTLPGPWRSGDPIVSEYQYRGRICKVVGDLLWYRTDLTTFDIGPFTADRFRPGWLPQSEVHR